MIVWFLLFLLQDLSKCWESILLGRQFESWGLPQREDTCGNVFTVFLVIILTIREIMVLLKVVTIHFYLWLYRALLVLLFLDASLHGSHVNQWLFLKHFTKLVRDAVHHVIKRRRLKLILDGPGLPVPHTDHGRHDCQVLALVLGFLHFNKKQAIIHKGILSKESRIPFQNWGQFRSHCTVLKVKFFGKIDEIQIFEYFQTRVATLDLILS